ncbi:MAG: SRPBCC family protein [Chlorobium sp.]|jgi:ribosome-associated toxin RatA of RatAB toxin-antitoxin module|uniref:SRPBCC family protein n=1 Tax=Chlorobium sp. TaxID=1095 RepID=UPI0025C6E013|nr:SRPBCC family protein [Chlorobium sp.]MCF8217063.1 SRPBCC family protein [Chlorobium sp.]MCF8271886.1 SRPBCC family protein [Chlorobium sp.]MCF8288280.1 SRPBCC family protein [Chlorobium sp.]MCF8291848.1 SRPBCC family protein [Chlorobium sp.]MCF8385962.1 SRPBCC family protein [Chlorobium sp.]
MKIEPNVPDQAETDRLIRGEIVIDLAFLPDDVTGIKAKIFVAAPPEAVWGALTDYDNLSRTLPKVVASSVTERSGSTVILDQIGKTGIFFFEKTVTFSLSVREERLKRILFEQISGDFERYRGSWQLFALPDHKGTILVYEAEIKPAFFAPALLVSFVQRQDLPGILKAHKRTAETALKL